MKNINKENILLIILVIILASVIGYYMWRGLNENEVEFPDYSNPVVDSQDSSIVVNDGSVEINTINDTDPVVLIASADLPDLDRPLKFSSDLPDDAKKMYTGEINKIVEVLKNDPTQVGYWVDLGIFRKAIGDYEGAAEVWLYVGESVPQYPVVYNNLGDLYGYYVRDFEKAEKYFLLALENGPNKAYVYRSMFEFYHNVLEDDVKAREILQKGISLNLDDSGDFQHLLDNL